MIQLPLILIQTPPQPDNTGSMWVLTQGIMAMAKKIDAAITPQSVGDNASLIDFLFYATAIVMVLALGYEVSKALRKGFGEGQGVMHTLLEPVLIKRGLRFAIFFFLGVATYARFYVGVGQDLPFGVNQSTVLKFTTDVLDPLAGDGDTSIDKPIDKLQQIADSLKSASNTFGAWNIVRTTQVEVAKEQAASAAEDYWTSVNPEDKGMLDGSATAPGDEDSFTEVMKEAVEKLRGVFYGVFGAIQVYAPAVLLTAANFGLDVYATRVIMLNGLFLMMAYKMVFAFLPVAFMLAFFPGMTGILVGCIRSLAVCIISLNVLSSATSTLMSPAGITMIAQQASNVPDGAGNNNMQAYVKKIYQQLSLSHPGFEKAVYMEAVKTGLNDTVNLYYLNAEAVFWAPARVLMMMALMVAFIGKIGVVVSDSLNGSMTFHRG